MRAAMILVACLCATSACRNGAAQGPYDGVVVTGRNAPQLVPPSVAAPADAEPMAAEVDLRWTIALLSDAEATQIEAARRVTLLDAEPVVEDPIPDDVEADLQLAADPHGVDEKPAASKSCTGVVKGRS